MGRYSTNLDTTTLPANNQNTAVLPPSNPFSQGAPGVSQAPAPGAQQMQGPPPNWPTVFPKPIIGLDLNGVIIEDKLLNSVNNLIPIQSALEAIRILRLKGHKLGILSDQPEIANGKMTTQNMDESIQQLMNIFGKAGIFTIDGILYNTSALAHDVFAKPNLGMIDRMQNEISGQINFKEGWYVGDSINDLKMADRAGAKPVLVLTGNGNKTLKELDRHSNKDLKKKTLVFNNLLEFAKSL